ncbi:cation:dicarboxylase symporter family transporter [Arcanobacterium hippocoleae]
MASPENAVASIMDPSFAMPPVFGVMTALILAIVLGLGMAAVRAEKSMAVFREFRDLIMKVILKTIVPLLPLHIFGIFLNMSKSGQFVQVLAALGKIFIFSFVLTIVMLVLQYLIAGSMAKRNPFTALWGMKDAYFTALGTSSSAATIPVTEHCAVKNGVTREIADFVVPLCAAIHLAGSTIKITAFALALQYMMGITPSFSAMSGFILMLGVIMVAAPGVPGGAITAAQGVLQGMLSFTDPMYGIMVAMYVAADSFGTAANVTGDGAIAIAVDTLAKGSLGAEKAAAMEASKDIISGRELEEEFTE